MSETTRWWWIRHAPVTVNEGRIYGQTDHPCDCSDEATFRLLARLLPADAVWVTSTLRRTHETAAAIRRHLPAEQLPLEQHAELSEQHFGDWQGRTHEELQRGELGHWHRFWLAPAETAPPGGESFAQLMHRVGLAMERIGKAYAGRDIITVTHGGTIRAALGHALSLQPEGALRLMVDNCSLSRIDHVTGASGSHDPEGTFAWRVEFHNLSPSRLAA